MSLLKRIVHGLEHFLGSNPRSVVVAKVGTQLVEVSTCLVCGKVTMQDTVIH